MYRLIDQPELLRRAVEESTVPVAYSVRFREYHLLRPSIGRALVDDGYGKSIDEDWVRGVELLYCPWTGEPLPGSLRVEWFDVVQNEFGLQDFDIACPVAGLPDELLSEEWWIKRHFGATNPVLSPDYDPPDRGDYAIPQPAPDTPPGFRHFPCRLPHDCEAMASGFEDQEFRDLIAYLPWTREFGFRIIDPGQPIDFQPVEIEPIFYCPYCGDSLPPSLRPEWERRLSAMNLTPESKRIPERLKSDTWWREAGH